MDWSRAKTIFIITFLLLNIFLGYQLNEKKDASNINFLLEATIQERLSEMNIVIEAELLDEQLTGTYISGAVEVPLDKEVERKKNSQKVVEVNDDGIVVSLNNPHSFRQKDGPIQEQAKEFVLQHINFGQHYRFSHYDSKLKQVFFYQTYQGKKVDNYESGRLPLLLQLNNDFEVVMYEQNYLTIQPIHPPGKEQELLSSMRAIEKLFNQQLIPPDSVITKIELSYYSFFKPPQGEVQVFAPMWNIGVNEQIYYVNAIDGAIQNIQ
ncbi:hypothetical protein BKP37_00280 [Anaerobacillus alkalilacustris]|uniref:Regulatory protein YycH-like domain-containing protein n=1 Tax=Anaerobacillus alkalilacustris TaxID=393763 RepID=A0A1S2LWX7_9BACI|nr:two-component system regulatory protein YycI [Anaerobacillus alkalilacustris]OIJ17029.1 hypothetical protein BKP37_00280 [Anaerobacillus alkalilacustris]